jgi:FkbM family methyltransferase
VTTLIKRSSQWGGSLPWLWHNVVTSWRYSPTVRDGVKRLRWTYASRLPAVWSAREHVIGFAYPDPIGEVRFLVRANGGADAFIMGEVFEHRYYNLGLRAQPETILDLGANAGFTATYFARVYPHAAIACVEPWPENARVLRRNLELNRVDADVFSAAIAVTDGHIRMERMPADYGHRIAATSTDTQLTVEVEALSVPTVMRRLQWRRIGLLKVDIEGYETVLFGAGCDWLRQVDAMCIECHDEFGASDLERLSDRFGFDRPRKLPGIWLLTRTPGMRP